MKILLDTVENYEPALVYTGGMKLALEVIPQSFLRFIKE